VELPRITQKTLLAFLSGTGLPLASSLGVVLRWTTLSLGVVSVGVAGALLLESGRMFDPVLPWSGAAAPLSAAPLFFMSFVAARRARLHLAAVALFAGLYALSVISCVPRGPLAPAWTVQPLLAVAVTCCLGAGTGLGFTVLGCAALGYVTFTAPPPHPAVDPVVFGSSLIAATLAAALLGVLVHRVLLAALTSEEDYRIRFRDSRKALRHREKLLRHALRVETVGDLAGLVVHQLRNQFQLVVGHVFMGKRERGDARTHRLELIAEVLHDARPLLDQLMGLANPDDGRPCHSDLNALIRDFDDKMRRVVPSRLVLRTKLSSRPLPVVLDPRGLEHALWNLVINAGHAMPVSGELRLETGADENQAWVAIEDTGTGISPDNLAQVFEPYFTTKAPGAGTGLGLTAVSRFVRAARGEVEVDSELGRGTRFTLSFPIATAGPSLLQGDAEALPEPQPEPAPNEVARLSASASRIGTDWAPARAARSGPDRGIVG